MQQTLQPPPAPPAAPPIETQATATANTGPIPPFFETVQQTSDQRISSLENSMAQLMSLLQQAAPPAAQQVPPTPPQQPQPAPHPLAPPPIMPALPTAMGGPFVPPISPNLASNMSLERSLPHVESALRLAIARHEFRPGHLYKLDATVKENPKVKTFEISDNGDLTECEREGSLNDYPSFRSLYDPLVIYFEILGFFVISSGNLPVIHQVVLGCFEYLRILYQIYTRYKWSAVLQYHFLFHSRRLAEMREGDYSGWRVVDAELASLYLYGNPKSTTRTTGYSSPTSSQNSKQVCFAFQTGKCSSPCAHGRIHKCRNCQSPDHGKAACTKKAEASS